ncbi:MAG: enoyl-CoA hydratase/isomerase family protein [Chitinophagaceae bacterium]|nr:MAG: enoyl-CoA hydratase/isomerase family protein [Chitinophagaceae bacterium]
MDEEYVKSETHNGITSIEFYHPQSNSLPAKLLQQLAHEIHFAGTHAETKVIVLKSAGEKSFCAGAYFTELIAIKTPAEGLAFFSGFAQVINAMRKCPKFIIARIHGKCVGGGVGLAAAADYSIAVEGADIKLSELNVGIGPFVVGPVIERKIGKGAFNALAIDASMWRNSDWAKRKGLFAEVHETMANMDESILRLSTQLSHSNPEAMAEMKKVFWEDAAHWDDLLSQRAAISGRLVLSEFSKKAIEKFKAKV